MARIEKTVFISYRVADRYAALAVFKDLTQHGYDVFIDFDGIASGDFERAIVDNIRARAHFVLVLTPGSLERCVDPNDWVRREVELAIELRRNIVPLLMDGFSLSDPTAVQNLQGAMEPLRRYQAIAIPNDFFDEAMERLRKKFLCTPVDAVVHPPSAHARRVARKQQRAATQARSDTTRGGGETGERPGWGRWLWRKARAVILIALAVAAASGVISSLNRPTTTGPLLNPAVNQAPASAPAVIKPVPTIKPFQLHRPSRRP